MTDCLSRLTTTMRRSRLPGLFAIAFLGPVVNATIPGPSTALLNYLRIGSVRVGLTSDTLLEHGKPVPLTWASFADVERMLGTAEMGARGDASTSLRWICYRLAGDVSMSLLLESDEIAGGEYIDNFELVPVRSRPDLEANCVPVNIPASAVETDRGIKLALTRREVEKRLGVAGGDSAGVVVFERSLDKVMRHRDGTREAYTESAGFTIRFRDGHAIEIVAWRMDST